MIEPVNTVDGQAIAVQSERSKRQSKKHPVLIGLVLLLCVISTVSAVAGYLVYHTYTVRYHSDLALAQAGLQSMQKAETLLATWSHSPLDLQGASQAEAEFTSAVTSFGALQRDLLSLPQIIRLIPSYGLKLSSALRLVPLALSFAGIGVIGSRILQTLSRGLRDPLAPQGQGLTSSALASIVQDAQELRTSLASVTQQIKQLKPADMQFDARLPKLLNAFHQDAPLILQWLGTFEQYLPVAPALLGIGPHAQANYLIEVLDSTELRPGGGFIGNYGIATFSGGHLVSARITDVDLLDRPFEFAGHMIPYPAAYTWFDLWPSSWSLRDSNLDADFPTVARYGEATYREEGGTEKFSGVIAITPTLIEQILTMTGPISVPEYHETVTAQNVVSRIHFHQLGGRAAGEGSDSIASPDGHSSLRKRFTELLAEHLQARVLHLPASDLPKLLLLLFNSLRSKDVQLYLNSSSAEHLLQHLGLDASIQSPSGDSFMVVDANIAGNKANSFIINTLHDQVTVDSQGSSLHRMTLRYAWTIAGLNYGDPLYRDFVRVYVPPGSILLVQDGWQPRGLSSAFGRKVWAGFFTLTYGETKTITLVWKVPSVAHKDQHGWHYQYLMQRQAGNLWQLHLQLTMPRCAAVSKTWGGLLLHGKQTAELSRSFTEDLNMGADYACK